MSKPAFEIGKEYMERFVRIREQARKMQDAYFEILSVRSASDYSQDRVQTGRTGDPTAASAFRLMKVKARFERAETAYEKEIERLDDLLSGVTPFILRTVTVLHYIDGRSVGGMAEMLYKKGGGKYSPDTISNLKHQALVEIGKAIKEKAPA